jgi:hypothetical protein
MESRRDTRSTFRIALRGTVMPERAGSQATNSGKVIVLPHWVMRNGSDCALFSNGATMGYAFSSASEKFARRTHRRGRLDAMKKPEYSSLLR